MPSHWGLGLQHMNSEGTQRSVHKSIVSLDLGLSVLTIHLS